MPFIIACLIGAFVDLSGAGLPRSAAVIAAVAPTASSSCVLARQLGGDAPLMASPTTVQVPVATLPTMIWIAGA